MTGATDGPGSGAILRHMETLDEYLARRAEVRAQLTQDDGEEDWLVRYALGKIPRSTFQSMDDIFSDGWYFKRQAE